MSTLKNRLSQKVNYYWQRLFMELLVVFLGVTAGFLLNNWQLQEKDQVLEEKYLESFIEDVNSNIAELKKAINADSMWLARARPKLLLMKEGAISIDSANSLVRQIVSISRIDIQTGTYEDITNSGNLNLLSNYKVKKQIVDYHVEISGIEFIDTYFYDFFNDYVMPFVIEHYSVLKEKLIDARIIKSDRFGNIITSYYAVMQQRKAAYDNLLKQSYQLIIHLEGEK